MLAHPGDFRRNVEQGMGDLAGDHVDFVRVSDGDDDVGVGDARLFQDIRVRCVADHAVSVQGVADAPDQVGVLVYDRHVIAFKGQVAGNVEADLSGAADDNFHGLRAFVAVKYTIAIVYLRSERPEI